MLKSMDFPLEFRRENSNIQSRILGPKLGVCPSVHCAVNLTYQKVSSRMTKLEFFSLR